MKFGFAVRHYLVAVITMTFVSLSYGTAYSQSVAEEQESPKIVKAIEANSEGDIKVDIPSSIVSLIEPVKPHEIKEDHQSAAPSNRTRISTSGPRQTNGYRIQIFSDGRNQRTLQARAQARSNSVISRFPKYRNQVYSFSKAPNWYTRIGNFKTHQEAMTALSELKRAFPGFAGEMRVVKSNIIVVD